MSFSNWTEPVAKKPHHCVHCTGFILAGEKHFKFVGVWEWDFQDWRVHSDCRTALERCQDEYGELCDERHERGRSCNDKALAAPTDKP